MKEYGNHVWFIKAPLGYYYRCRTCMAQPIEARCRSYFIIDSNGESEPAWDEYCPFCQEPVILKKKWWAGFYQTKLWKLINSLRPVPRLFE